ncbi:MAG: hypothetical protein IJB86_01030 [Clostridia bacterium]|nr:hypothetical protein [Clostridia bacterium]MBQ7053872.1 hypothetical protein [Oscillospiraceae bacterium]
MDNKGLLSDSLIFHRRFSVNPYKTLKMPLSRMDFYRDWLSEPGGDPYPLIGASQTALTEKICDCSYSVYSRFEKSFAERLITTHFPYCSYELELLSMDDGSEAGFSLINDERTLRVFLRKSKNGLSVVREVVCNGFTTDTYVQKADLSFKESMTFTLTCSNKGFAVYLKTDKKPICVFSFTETDMIYAKQSVFTKTSAALYVCAKDGASISVCNVCSYLDGGMTQADIRSLRFEDGTPITEDGKLFFTVSVREKCGGYQAVLSWNPSGCDFCLEGALFFDYGDGIWYSDIASSVIFNRKTNEWYVWAVSFTHDHMLIRGKTTADLRYGINLVSVTKMEPISDDSLSEDEKDRLFVGKSSDEDPDFIYDEKTNKWYLTVCRSVNCGDRNRYRYFLFESDNPFDGYTFKDKTVTGSDTGGSIIRVDDELYFVCGSDGDLRSNYHAYSLSDLSECKKMRFDHDDGGFRGWGTIVPLPYGNMTRLVWLTFDRHNADPDNRWSYGNLYAFEAFI